MTSHLPLDDEDRTVCLSNGWYASRVNAAYQPCHPLIAVHLLPSDPSVHEATAECACGPIITLWLDDGPLRPFGGGYDPDVPVYVHRPERWTP